MHPLRNMSVALLSGFVLAAIGDPAAAHHSFAMYDSTKVVTVTGTVKVFQWTNPHPILWVYVDTEKNGQGELWSFELSSSPGPLGRLGWTKHSLQPGDKVAVEMNPLRDNQHGGSLKKATLLLTGQVLTTAGGSIQTTTK